LHSFYSFLIIAKYISLYGSPDEPALNAANDAGSAFSMLFQCWLRIKRSDFFGLNKELPILLATGLL